MGLTIHYTLATRQPLDGGAVRNLVAQARVFAQESEAESISRVVRVGPDFPLADEWVAIRQAEESETHVDVPPQDGHVFQVSVGKDCEPLLLGLCRYPAAVRHRGREVPTRVGAGWRLSHFCKTQYAGLHGWEYFLRCHRTAIDLLAFWRTLGVRVQILDEGGYWPRRSVGALRRNLDKMNGIVAAMGGALKDIGGGTPVEAPIFRHPRFEHLEADGVRRHKKQVDQAAAALRRITRRA